VSTHPPRPPASRRADARLPKPGRDFFLPGFLFLTVLGGMTIGMGKLATTLFALELGASAAQIGLIAAAESLGMMLVTVPAGFIIARYGAPRVYFVASMGPALLCLLLPFAPLWWLLAAGRGMVGLCIPFRIVSMNSSFLEKLRTLGPARTGWYRATNSIGIAMIGPAVAHALISAQGPALAFGVCAGAFLLLALLGRALLPAADGASPAAAPDPTVDGTGFLQQIRALLADRVVAESCLIEYLSSSTSSLHGTFIVVVAIAGLGLPQGEAVQLVMIHGVSSVCALFLLGALLHRLPRPLAYGTSFTLACSGLLLLGTGSSFVTLAAGGLCLATGSALIHLVNMDQMSRHPVAKSKISGLYSLAQMSGSFSGALLGGLLAGFIMPQRIFLAWLPLVLAGALLLRVRARRIAPVIAVAAQRS
jgi:MFS family permease